MLNRKIRKRSWHLKNCNGAFWRQEKNHSIWQQQAEDLAKQLALYIILQVQIDNPKFKAPHVRTYYVQNQCLKLSVENQENKLLKLLWALLKEANIKLRCLYYFNLL